MRSIFIFGAASACVLAAGPLLARQAVPEAVAAARDTVPVHVLEPIVVEGRSDDLTTIARSASHGLIGYRDYRLRPLMREAELLEAVPGLIMTQHSGDGKSNQMFVRGFDLDHGTDFSTIVEGMPVNIPTHAHGQGYTDINFIIPELVDHVEYRLGTYYADLGDFSAAGGAHLRLRRTLSRPLISVGLGENGHRRLVAAASAPAGPGELLAGGELRWYDGPWAVPQGLQKRSGLARYSWQRGSSYLSVLAMGYRNDWAASDQIPARLVDAGALDRLAQVDSSLGGATSRASLSATWMRAGTTSSQRLDLYGIAYDLDLYSNFTYFLENPHDGDQIQQRDDGRRIFGANLAHLQPVGRHDVTAGVQMRLDLADVALRWSRARTPVEAVREDEIKQWSSGAYVEVESAWKPRIRTVLALRGDLYHFDVTSDRPENSGTASDGILSPKASVIFTLRDAAEAYVSGGFGFHSNDARGIVQTVDPGTGEAVDPVDPLVPARGAEVGLRATPLTGWRSTLALWTVELDSELLFEGDEGTTEPSDGSRRFGVTWANHYRMTPNLASELDVSLARARFRDVPADERHIPGAMENVVTAGLTWDPTDDGPFAVLRFRRFGAFSLLEDNSVRAEPTSIINVAGGWVLGRARLGVSVLNVLDSTGADMQYFYASRLPGEPADGVEDVHFHPVEPRQLRFTLSWGL